MRRISVSIWEILILVAVVGGFIYLAVTIIQSDIADMQFQLTHPITRARVLSIFTHTYTTVDGGGCSAHDPQTGLCYAYFPQTETTHTETCAERISFRANGQDIEINVREMLACSLQIGDQPKIAYDPRQPAHLQFVPSGDPFWGNILQILLALAFAGGALAVGIEFISFLPGEHGFRASTVFCAIGAFCIIALIVMSVINRNP